MADDATPAPAAPAPEPWTAQMRIAEGRLLDEAPGIAMVERRDARGRGLRAYLLAESLGAGGDPFLEAMVSRTAEQFDPSGRSLTGAMARALEERHRELREWNRAQLPAAQASYAVSCVIARAGEAPILGQAGPTLALIAGGPGPEGQRPLSVRMHGGDDPVAAAVGGALPLRMQFVQGAAAGGWALLISSAAARLFDPAGRAAVSRLGGEQVLQHLFQGMLDLRDAAALMIDLEAAASPPAYLGAAAADPFGEAGDEGDGGG